METKLKLKDITTEYSKFNANQVLTEKQLNTFIDYFEDQNRLSRLGLSGVGLVCGFEVLPQFNVDKKAVTSIEITQGVAVTTDGDLVQFFDLIASKIKSKTFSFFKKFEDDKGQYPRFLNSQEKQFNLWELHSEKDDSYTDLVSFKNIQKMAVLLYVEQYSKEDVLCNKLTCDNQGIEQINNLRVLLVDSEDLEAIATRDAIFLKHNWYKINNELPIVEAKRVVLHEKNTETFSDLKAQFNNVVKDESISTDLILGYDVLLSKFKKPSISAKIKSLFSFSSLAVPLDFQYRYDVLKDLIDTYNEIKELLLHINVNCCPSIGAFPKHIMLGKLKKATVYPELRHRFYKSTIIGNEDENLQKVALLINRAIAIANSYIGKEKSGEIVITPSQAHTFLSNKAVPFYYNVSSDFLKKWDFNKTKNYRENQNLSYHKSKLSSALAIQKPLSYNIDKNDFYRIEGHQGKMYREALEKILKLKKDNGLSFDVKTLSINATEQNININKYECEFEDLKMLLNAWRTEQNCILSEVSKTFSAFKLTDPKVNSEVDKVISRKNKGDFLDKEIMADSVLMDRTERFSRELGFKEEVKHQYDTSVKEYELFLEEENIIKKSLTKDKDSLGFLIEQVFDKNKKGSASDIIVALNKETVAIRDKDLWKKEPELSDFILKDVTETLVHAYVLDAKVPLNIRDIDTNVLVNYKLTIEELCKQVKTLQAKYNSTSLKLTIKQILGLLINQLSIVCCSGKKLETLLIEIDKRKKKILKKIQLSEFVKQHPGLEHKAGVMPGGTFVMVYVTENAADKNTFDDVVLNIVFRRQPIDTGKELEEFPKKEKKVLGNTEILYKNGGVINLWSKNSSVEFSFVDRNFFDFKKERFLDSDVVLVGKTLPETVSNFSTFLNRTWSRAGLSKILKAEETLMFKDGSVGMQISIKDHLVPKDEYFFQMYNPAVLGSNKRLFFDENQVIIDNATLKNTVVADFSLPYMCCSDCTPVNFVIPKEPAFLNLPVKSVCLKKDTEVIPLEFLVRPIDGEVKAILPKDIQSGVFKDPNDNKYKIDITKIAKSALAKPIKFTVNDEPTDCELIVYPELELFVGIEEPIEYNKEKTLARVTYVLEWKDTEFVNEDFFNSITYSWDFMGDGTKVKRSHVNNRVIENYKLPISELSNEINPVLEISLGPCQKSIPIKTIIFDTFTPSELAIQPSYCLDSMVEKTVRIKFSNVKGSITLLGDDIKGLKIEGEELVIDVAVFRAFEQTIEFLEDGQSTNARIVIHEVKQISILERKESRFIWKNGQLFYEAAFEGVLPDGVKPVGLIYGWNVNGVKSSNELFNPQLLIKEGAENVFTISLTITDNNGCSSSAEFIKSISFPNFTVTLPDVTYCLNDNTPYKVTVEPDYEGVQLSGGNVKFNNDNKMWEFIPANSGITKSVIVTINIIGAFASGTANLIAAPKANFTHSFDETTKKLSLTNSSEKADEYVWTINGDKRDPQTKRVTITEDLNNFNGDMIEVSLTVFSKCDENTKTETIEIRNPKEKTCEDKIKSILIQEQNTFKEEDKLIELDDLEIKRIVDNVIIPTKGLYGLVLEELSAYLNGSMNSILEKQFLILLDNTSVLLNKDKSSSVLKKYYRSQVKLFMSILHCQEVKTLEDAEKNISTRLKNILDTIDTDLSGFKESGIKLDINDVLPEIISLKTFLENCAEINKSESLKNFITKNLITKL
ncbi:hypothetical protein [Tenacibaculum halocynthiae]|uniref:hypothetical protein n=1 Tax=Tenacibaculum halocynthiae TaxID=1254437 RepID=UPI003D647649